MTPRLRDLDWFLRYAECAVGLLDRCQPVNWAEEIGGVIEECKRGHLRAPRWRYTAAPALCSVLRALERVIEHGLRSGPWGRLYALRALELWHEARLVERVGTRDFIELAAKRFFVDESEHGNRAEGWAREWAAAIVAENACLTSVSDDDRDPSSLVCQMRHAIGVLRLPVRVIVRNDLAACAAAGEGVVVIRAGQRHSRQEAQRVVVHEIFGHLVPRCNGARESLGLFTVGTHGATDDEEGRALLLERRAGLFGARRRRELGLRHIAALSVRRGADWIETTRSLLAWGIGVEEAVVIASRAYRGGGLGREVVYLPALSRVGSAFSDDPDLELWFERGRVSIEAAGVLRQLGEPPDCIRAA